jgi:hypothetical protein
MACIVGHLAPNVPASGSILQAWPTPIGRIRRPSVSLAQQDARF